MVARLGGGQGRECSAVARGVGVRGEGGSWYHVLTIEIERRHILFWHYGSLSHESMVPFPFSLHTACAAALLFWPRRGSVSAWTFLCSFGGLLTVVGTCVVVVDCVCVCSVLCVGTPPAVL